MWQCGAEDGGLLNSEQVLVGPHLSLSHRAIIINSLLKIWPSVPSVTKIDIDQQWRRKMFFDGGEQYFKDTLTDFQHKTKFWGPKNKGDPPESPPPPRTPLPPLPILRHCPQTLGTSNGHELPVQEHCRGYQRSTFKP